MWLTNVLYQPLQVSFHRSSAICLMYAMHRTASVRAPAARACPTSTSQARRAASSARSTSQRAWWTSSTSAAKSPAAASAPPSTTQVSNYTPRPFGLHLDAHFHLGCSHQAQALHGPAAISVRPSKRTGEQCQPMFCTPASKCSCQTRRGRPSTSQESGLDP